MRFFRKYLVFHFMYVLRGLNHLHAKTDKHLFAFLFNLKSVLLFSPVRLCWNGATFTVTDRQYDGKKYQIRHQAQCILAYQFGFSARAENLSKSYFLDRINFMDGDIFFDCGANVGDVKIYLDMLKPTINYVGFEPSPVEYDCLQQNADPSNTHNIGLWNEKGELNFYVSSQGADSSLIKPSEYDKIISVKTRRLEDYVTETIKCLKLEAEGAEPEILQGLGDKLSLVEYITADLGFERGVNCETTLPAVTNYLLEREFELLEVGHRRVCALYRNKRFKENTQIS